MEGRAQRAKRTKSAGTTTEIVVKYACAHDAAETTNELRGREKLGESIIQEGWKHQLTRERDLLRESRWRRIARSGHSLKPVHDNPCKLSQSSHKDANKVRNWGAQRNIKGLKNLVALEGAKP